MQRRVSVIVMAAVLAYGAGGVLSHADEVREQHVRFAPGESDAKLADAIRGRDSVIYRLDARAGQQMTISLDASNSATYFNVYAPGRGPGDEALAVGDQTGPMMPDLNRFDGLLPESGTYTVSVYLYRAAARRNETSQYTISFAIRDPSAQTAGDALVPGTTFHATGTIPCRRDRERAMSDCNFGVVRKPPGGAEVTVFWPDGGTRVITFRDGEPVAYDASEADAGAPLAWSRAEGGFVVTIGAQRFEIFDAIIFGG
jgi:hypothetical protein